MKCPTCQIMKTPWWFKLLGALALIGAVWLYAHIAGIRVSIQPNSSGMTMQDFGEKLGIRSREGPP